jgi:hypothetical protein
LPPRCDLLIVKTEFPQHLHRVRPKRGRGHAQAHVKAAPAKGQFGQPRHRSIGQRRFEQLARLAQVLFIHKLVGSPYGGEGNFCSLELLDRVLAGELRECIAQDRVKLGSVRYAAVVLEETRVGTFGVQLESHAKAVPFSVGDQPYEDVTVAGREQAVDPEALAPPVRAPASEIDFSFQTCAAAIHWPTH